MSRSIQVATTSRVVSRWTCSLVKNGIKPFSQLKLHDAALAEATLERHCSGAFRCRNGRGHACGTSSASSRWTIPMHKFSRGAHLFVAPCTLLFEDEFLLFHVFINMSPPRTKQRRYQYVGDYKKVPVARTTVEVEDWLNLPIRASAVSHSLDFCSKGTSVLICLPLLL